MAVESAADLASFFNADEHGEAGLWSAAGAWDPSAVTVVMDRPDRSADLGGIDVVARRPTALVQLVELPATAGQGDRLVITATGENFEVVAPLERDETLGTATALLRPWGAA